MFIKATGLCVFTALFSAAALAASTTTTATLKDLQTVGSTTKKQKHQQYDFVVDTPTNGYVCRTKLGSSIKPTQFVVGSSVEFKVDKGSKKARSRTPRATTWVAEYVKVVAPNTPYSPQ